MISVILPVRDGEAWVAEALESLLSQTVPPGEILVGDDGSSDGTAGVLDRFRSSTVKVFASSETRGVSRTCNDLVSLATGRHIARMDADDIALPRRFEKQLGVMRDTGATVVGTWARRFGAADTLHATPITHHEVLAQLGISCPIVNPTVMVDREGLGKDPLYVPETRFAADYELFASLRGIARFANIPEVLLLWRKHSKNIGTDPETLASQCGTVSIVRARIWLESGLFLTPEEEAALDELAFSTDPHIRHSGALLSAFRKALEHPRPDELWAPITALRDLFLSRWEYYCRLRAWGNFAILPTWWNGVRELGCVPSPKTFSVLAAKTLLRRKSQFLSRFSHTLRASHRRRPTGIRGFDR